MKIKIMFKKIWEIVKYHWITRDQHTFCYCPVCSNELCYNSYVDPGIEKTRELEVFKCSRCGSISKWDFDIAPVPIILKWQPLSKEFVDTKRP